MLRMMVIALVSCLASVSLTKLEMRQDYASYYPYYTGVALHPASLPFVAATGPQPSGVQSKVLGIVDLILLNKLTTRVTQLEETIKNLISNSEATTLDVVGLKSDLTAVKGTVEAMSKPTSIDAIPTSCNDLQKLGYTKSGLFNVLSGTKVPIVYCDFTKPSDDSGFETTLGNVYLF